MSEPLIFELSRPGRRGFDLPANDVPSSLPTELIPAELLADRSPALPEVSEVDVVRHFTRLSRMNYGVDVGFYPLGSCTMKYNPKINEETANLPGFTGIHPYQPAALVQGALQLMYEVQQDLAEITGMDAVSLQPAAGAHGEFSGMMVIKAYLEQQGQKRNKVIVPDSAHGTNPASAALCGFKVVEVRSNERGGVDVASLRSLMGPDVAALMLTNPNTLGLFDENIQELADIVHQSGGLLYYDGANMNAVMGYARPGDMGFDVVHLNLHKTFSTPHGGGGPGSGPIGVKQALAPFLPRPLVVKTGDQYLLDDNRPLSIGKVRSFYGNFGVVVKAYTYLKALGGEGLRAVSENAVLNANYMMQRLKGHFKLAYDRTCMHEFVISPEGLKEKGVHTLDVAKRLLDYGYHPPTIYFPLIVEEAIMVEPTETESKETLDAFCDVMIQIAREAQTDPKLVQEAPYHTPVRRLDEVTAARKPVLRWLPE